MSYNLLLVSMFAVAVAVSGPGALARGSEAREHHVTSKHETAEAGEDDQEGEAEEHHEESADAHHENGKHEEQHAETKPSKPGFFSVMTKGFGEYFGSFMTKVNEMRELDENYESAKERAIALEIENKELRSHKSSEGETHRAERIKHDAREEGGHETSRTIASLEADPGLLSKPPRFVFQAASKAFESGDYETAAKAYFALVSNQENATYQNSQTYYLAAVSLYHVGNYKVAQELFQKLASGHIDDGAAAGYAPRAMAWLSLCRARVGDRQGARAIASKLVQTHPKSREAQRVNRDEKFR